MEKYKRVFEAKDGYAVVRLGGSVGESYVRSTKELKGKPYKADLLSREQAIEKSKRLNKLLSPGEKKYYGLKYVVIEIKDGKVL